MSNRFTIETDVHIFNLDLIIFDDFASMDDFWDMIGEKIGMSHLKTTEGGLSNEDKKARWIGFTSYRISIGGSLVLQDGTWTLAEIFILRKHLQKMLNEITDNKLQLHVVYKGSTEKSFTVKNYRVKPS